MRGNLLIFRLDWVSIFLLLFLIGFGWVNIYSTTVGNDLSGPLLDLGTFYGKQLFFAILSLIVVILYSFIPDQFIERFSSVFYLIGIALLLGLFVFGKTIAGATSWYDLGPFNFQPSELMKMIVALALAKYLSDTQVNLRYSVHQGYAVLLLVLPSILVIAQPDPGSALVFFSLFLVLLREGLPLYYLTFVLSFILAFAATLKFGLIYTFIGALALYVSYLWLKPKRLKTPTWFTISYPVILFTIIASTTWVYNSVFKQHHRDRFSLWLNLETNQDRLLDIKQSIGYNTYQAKQAIASGRWSGKGFLEGTRTKGDFVPAQHSDYIFSSVGEEWGFITSALVILAFVALLLRFIYLADRQKKAFHRIYGYGITSILFIHFGINIGMVLGMLPTIGIPLPFFSYGGSSLLFFCLMCYIFLKMDANRLKTHFD